MPSFFDLQKYAATGIAAPDMSAYDKARALAAFGGGKTQTLTDVPPLSFKANGKPLISWSMLGNGQQTGTPTPDAPIQPEFVGVRTAQLWDVNELHEAYSFVIIDDATVLIPYVSNISQLYFTGVNVSIPAPFTISFNGVQIDNSATNARFRLVFEDDTISELYITNSNGTAIVSNSQTFNKNLKSIRFNFSVINDGFSFKNLMLNAGTEPLPYEPFGWAEKIANAGQTVTIYLGQTQTVRKIGKLILTGNERYAKDLGAEYLYYVYAAHLYHTDCLCSHLKSTNTGYPASQAGCSAYNNAAIIYLNFGADVMNAQPSGNSVEGLKEYIAAQYAAGTPVCVWYVLAEPTTGIINEPLCKIGDYADELHSKDAAVTIPTVKGDNVLTVDTELQPSEMTITYFEEV